MPEQVFDIAGTYQWTCPNDVTSVQSEEWGGGGGGGCAVGTHTGGGGGGGGYSKSNAIPVVPGTVYNVVVGAGGVGWESGHDTWGASCGKSSWFGSPSLALGHGGLRPIHSHDGGGGGSAVYGVGDVRFSGGNGGSGNYAGNNTSGGGAGSSAGTADKGTSGIGCLYGGQGGVAPTGGGNGGHGGTTTTPPIAGSIPGGGGGGGSTAYPTGAAGATGKVVLTW